MRTFIGLLLAAAALPLAAQSFQIHGFVTAREISVKSDPSWSEGGFGRFDVGANGPGDRRRVNVDVAQLGIDWTPTTWLAFHGDGIARHEPAGTIGKRAGLLQAYVDAHTEKLRLRAGAFWLPTSRENVDPLWTSPYTITDSALNTWIGEEVRPIGVDLQFSPTYYISAGATAFRGNDTMGTVLAKRGWVFGNRLSVYDEDIAATGGTTRPIGSDLDHRNGHAERVRLQVPERALLQVTHIDNRSTLGNDVPGRTPWLTKFNIVGGTLGMNAPATLSAEWASGNTTVGFPGGTYTMDFDTAYVLLSRKVASGRISARVERFVTHSAPTSPSDPAREHGHAVTIAYFHDVQQHLRVGSEYARVSGTRPAAGLAGFDSQTGGSTWTVELRYGF